MARRWLAGGVLLACAACPSSTPAASVAPTPAGLRVPLPDGWVATASPEGLVVGPAGRPVGTLEHVTDSVPSAGALAGWLTDAGAQALEPVSGLVGFVYRTSSDGPFGFVGVHADATGSVRCASTRGSEAEVRQVAALCRGVTRRASADTPTR